MLYRAVPGPHVHDPGKAYRRLLQFHPRPALRPTFSTHARLVLAATRVAGKSPSWYVLQQYEKYFCCFIRVTLLLALHIVIQVALLSQRGRAILRVCQ